MTTLILKTQGMAAYGVQTFDVARKINTFPTRSAIVGLLSAALGYSRKEHSHIASLSAAIKIAVQVNAQGQKITDYHTVQNFRSPTGKIQTTTKQTYREYLCDTEYSFAIQGNTEFISQLAKAVKSPKFTVFQGRKSCPLTRPLFECIVDTDNPVDAIILTGGKGQIFSDIEGPGAISTIQVRDVITATPRKYATRIVYVCAPKEVHHELTH
ncbi:type I-E CRISPR-associated protein Cas5/CasD [Saccharophagus degradans]|uniref:Type I-E CRISPR-associated protein Cas5/CasD n=1 Tax=Saccharophagus degradans TaxID=86304 RepID=A0AAW7X5V3_9GAMM|nr:type I-E CRISPR-associated protein Cas5/CasD [Saccharophagus degradans]MDO6422769.1 type I-E CRISPR-associated protein Cas5/CasD [Saccharophagus degradans]MDO6606242.1 type I-E CRISPR-associated protein Cas5/CasD [Saccharophagus degradans]